MTEFQTELVEVVRMMGHVSLITTTDKIGTGRYGGGNRGKPGTQRSSKIWNEPYECSQAVIYNKEFRDAARVRPAARGCDRRRDSAKQRTQRTSSGAPKRMQTAQGPMAWAHEAHERPPLGQGRSSTTPSTPPRTTSERLALQIKFMWNRLPYARDGPTARILHI